MKKEGGAGKSLAYPSHKNKAIPREVLSIGLPRDFAALERLPLGFTAPKNKPAKTFATFFDFLRIYKQNRFFEEVIVLDDKRLIQKLKRGDRAALNRVMERFTPYLSTVVWNVMGSAASLQDVEEVVADVYLSLWTHRDTLDPVQGVKSWLAAAARNRAIDRMRASPPPPLPLEDGLPEGGPSPEEELERRAFAAALLQAVEALPPPDNELVYRFYYEEERLRDIARDLGLSVPAAKSRLCRARKKLKAILIKGGLADGTA